MVGQADHFNLVLGIVIDDNLDGIYDGNAAQRDLVEVVTHASLQLTHVHGMIGIGHACFAHKGKERIRGVTAAAQTAKGGQTGVIPAVYVALLNQLTQITLGHDRVGNVHAAKLPLVGLLRKADLINHPVVKRTVVSKFTGAQGMGNAFQRVLNGMCEVIHGIYAPFVTLAVMMDVLDSVNNGVTQVRIVTGGVDLCAQRACTVREFTVLHSFEQIKVFFHRAVAVGGFLGGDRAIGALVVCQVILGKVANVSVALLDQLNGKLVALAKVIGAVEHAARGGSAQPLQVLADGANEFVGFLCGVGVVVAQVEQTVILIRHVGIDADSLDRADVQIAVGLGRESGVNLELGISAEILGHNVKNKVVVGFCHGFILLVI